MYYVQYDMRKSHTTSAVALISSFCLSSERQGYYTHFLARMQSAASSRDVIHHPRCGNFYFFFTREPLPWASWHSWVTFYQSVEQQKQDGA